MSRREFNFFDYQKLVWRKAIADSRASFSSSYWEAAPIFVIGVVINIWLVGWNVTKTDLLPAFIYGVVAILVWITIRFAWARIMAPLRIYVHSTRKMKGVLLDQNSQELNAAKIALSELIILCSREKMSQDLSEVHHPAFGELNKNRHPIFQAHGLNVLRASVIQDAYELIRGHTERNAGAARLARAKFRKKAEALMYQISNPDP